MPVTRFGKILYSAPRAITFTVEGSNGWETTEHSAVIIDETKEFKFDTPTEKFLFSVKHLYIPEPPYITPSLKHHTTAGTHVYAPMQATYNAARSDDELVQRYTAGVRQVRVAYNKGEHADVFPSFFHD
jgi:hypothetical protein